MSKIKICGLFREEDIEVANAVRPDFIGFVFAKSRRRVTPEQAAALRKGLQEGIRVAGVFVNAEADQIVALAEENVIDLVQLHGQEDDDYIAALKKRMGLPVIKAVNMAEFLKENPPSRLNQCWPEADYLLLDNGPGGTGTAFDWKTVTKMERPWFLAGGIDVENVQEALKLNPFAVDVSSGAETEGVKDPEKMKSLVSAVHRPGRFGDFGGQYLPETLMNEILKLEKAYRISQQDPAFRQELNHLLNQYAGRPSSLYFAEKLTAVLGGARIYLKREDMNHTGSHKINNVLGQTLLAKQMGKTRVIAETGAGQHGVAAATAAALLDMECEVFMGEEDMERQALNVYRMELLGAKVNGVTSGTRTLKDAVNETMREWVRRSDDTHYVLGSVMGPHPFPEMVRDFQSVVSLEARAQILEAEGKLPAAVLACVGGGSNAIGMFWHFIQDVGVALIGCEAAGDGIDTPRHAATMTMGDPGVFHGMKSYFCQDDQGQIAPVYSISAGLDYPGIGPEHAWLRDAGRAKYLPVTDEEAVSAFEFLAETEGIICAVESAHAVAYARKLAPTMAKDSSMIICLSGRGDKDVAAIARYRGVHIYE